MYRDVIITNENFQGLNPVQFGYEDCSKGHFFGPAVRTYYLIHFVVSGFGYYTINGKEYNIGPGEMFIIPPYEETFYKADKENPWSYIWIGFTSSSKLPVSLSDVIRYPKAASVFNDMKNCENLSNGRSAYLSARLWDLFAMLLDRQKKDKSTVEKAIDFIHSEYMYPITVESISERIGIDRCHFSTLFKSKTGVSPKQYLLNYRMSVALSLMLENNKSVSVAALSVGYSDIYTFSKVFKKKYGISPSEYIKKNRLS